MSPLWAAFQSEATSLPSAHRKRRPAGINASKRTLIPVLFQRYELPFVTPELLFCKNLLLCNRQQTSFYLLVISPERTFRTAEVSHELGVSRLSFAPEDALPRLLGLEKGAVSPLGLWFDREKQVKLILERGLRRPGKIAFHPCDNRATVVFDQEIFWQRVVPGLAHEYTFVL